MRMRARREVQLARRRRRLYEMAVPADGGAATVYHVSGLAERAMTLAAYRPPVSSVRCARPGADASASYMALEQTWPVTHHDVTPAACIERCDLLRAGIGRPRS